jgi:hypothetical protein
VVGAVLVVFAIFMIFFYKNMKLQLDLSSLPKEVRSFYDNYYKSKSSWTKEGTTDFIWYRKQLVPGSDLWGEMSKLFSEFNRGSELIIADAYAVYNPALVSSFIAQLYVKNQDITKRDSNIIKNRMQNDPLLFKQRSYLFAAECKSLFLRLTED